MAGNDKSNTQTTEITPLATSEDIQDVWDLFPWKEFSGYVRSTRVANTTSWIWTYGFDIQYSDDDSKRRWVCRLCVEKKKHPPHNTVATGTQNAENHLFFEHDIWDPTGKRKAPVIVKEKTPSRNITAFFKLNPNNPREQQIASTLIGGFSRERF